MTNVNLMLILSSGSTSCIFIWKVIDEKKIYRNNAVSNICN